MNAVTALAWNRRRKSVLHSEIHLSKKYKVLERKLAQNVVYKNEI